MPTRKSAANRALIVGLVVPTIAASVGMLIQFVILPDLPDPVATHWRADGPDGYSSVWLVPLMTALVAWLLPVTFGVSVQRSLRRGERGYQLPLMPAVAAGLSVFMTVLLTGSLLIQRGLGSAEEAPGIDGVLAVALLAGLAVGVPAWLWQPRDLTPFTPAESAEPVSRDAGERVFWVGRTRMRGVPLTVLVLSVIGLIVAGLAVLIAGEQAPGFILIGIGVFVGLLVATFTAFHVRVDPSGLTVLSWARIVRLHVSAADVAAVTDIEVSGVAQFGGYGLRLVPGAVGVIMRSGPALEVTRLSGRRLVVTVDDAPMAAAVLARVVEDAHAAQD